MQKTDKQQVHQRNLADEVDADKRVSGLGVMYRRESECNRLVCIVQRHTGASEKLCEKNTIKE